MISISHPGEVRGNYGVAPVQETRHEPAQIQDLFFGNSDGELVVVDAPLALHRFHFLGRRANMKVWTRLKLAQGATPQYK